jgi:hypothetical protein
MRLLLDPFPISMFFSSSGSHLATNLIAQVYHHLQRLQVSCSKACGLHDAAAPHAKNASRIEYRRFSSLQLQLPLILSHTPQKKQKHACIHDACICIPHPLLSFSRRVFFVVSSWCRQRPPPWGDRKIRTKNLMVPLSRVAGRLMVVSKSSGCCHWPDELRDQIRSTPTFAGFSDGVTSWFLLPG